MSRWSVYRCFVMHALFGHSYALAADLAEAPGKPLVLGDEFLSEGEYGH
ncbi:MAG: hypothetical protein OXC26_07710 [Albidovulum sp.]|nr:hypothetical protein [Albidovulum sp.]